MRLVCFKSELAPIVTAVSRVAPPRPTIPILSGLKCIAKDNVLTLEATDLDISLRMSVPAEVIEEGEFVVTAKQFSDLIRKLSDEQVKISYTEMNQIEIKCGRSHFKLNSWPPSEYPAFGDIPDKYTVTIPAKLFKDAVKRVIISAAPREVRPNFAGIYFKFNEGKLTLVATDTYRLGAITVELPDIQLDTAMFVPTSVLNEVMRLANDDDTLTVWLNDGRIAFTGADFTITSRLLDYQFPAYEKVIPTSFETTVAVNRDELLSTLDRANLFIDNMSRFAIAGIKIDGDMMQIKAESSDGELKEDLFVTNKTGGELEVNFNCKFMADPLRVMDGGEIVMKFVGIGKPLVYEENTVSEYIHLVLPIQKVGAN